VRDLRDAQAGEVARRVGTLAAVLLEADVGITARAARQAAEALVRADPVRTFRDVSAVTTELQRNRRLRRVLVRTLRISGEAIEQDLVRKLARASTSTTELEGIARRLLTTQEEALVAIRQTLEIARETERHAESIDRKTGGTLPAQP
jgi:hypothetical protein